MFLGFLGKFSGYSRSPIVLGSWISLQFFCRTFFCIIQSHPNLFRVFGSNVWCTPMPKYSLWAFCQAMFGWGFGVMIVRLCWDGLCKVRYICSALCNCDEGHWAMDPSQYFFFVDLTDSGTRAHPIPPPISPQWQHKILLAPNQFVETVEPIVRLQISCHITNTRWWTAYFGAKPEVMADFWVRIDPVKNMPKGAHPQHMTWIFYFLKLYNQENSNSRNVGGIDAKTFQKWVWLFVDATSYLQYPVVSLCFDKSFDLMVLLD